MRNWSRLRFAQYNERSFGLRNSSGLLPVKITWSLVVGTLNKTRPWWSAIWIELTCSCTQSYMVLRYASLKTLRASPCPFSVWMRQPRLRCVTVHAGRIRWLARCTGYTLIKYPRHHRQVCSLAQVVSSSAASATSWTRSDSNSASLSCFASVRSPWPTISARGTAVKMSMN